MGRGRGFSEPGWIIPRCSRSRAPTVFGGDALAGRSERAVSERIYKQFWEIPLVKSGPHFYSSLTSPNWTSGRLSCADVFQGPLEIAESLESPA